MYTIFQYSSENQDVPISTTDDIDDASLTAYSRSVILRESTYVVDKNGFVVDEYTVDY